MYIYTYIYIYIKVYFILRASPSVCAKLCKTEKVINFPHFEQKITHISGCKIVHKCTITTVTLQICIVTVSCAFNILIIFSLSSLYVTLTSLSFSHFIRDSLKCTSLSFSHLINISSSSFRRSPSPLLSLSSFVSHCFWVEWG